MPDNLAPWISMGRGGMPSFMQAGATTNPAAGADTSGTSSTTFGPGQPAANLATDVSFGNLQAGNNITSLTNLINNLNAQNQQMLNKSRLGPAGETVQNQLLTNAGQYAAGQLPSDVINNALAFGAQSGAGRGFGVDDAATNAAVKRALGLDTVALNQMGQQNYLGLLAANPSAPLWGGQNNLVTPAVYSATADRQAQLELEYARLAAAQRAAANRGAGGGGGGGTPAASTATRPAAFPTTYPGGGATQPAGTTSDIIYDYVNTPGGASAAASGGDQTYQDWAQWFDPFGFGDWSMGGGGGAAPTGAGWDTSTNWLTGQADNPYFSNDWTMGTGTPTTPDAATGFAQMMDPFGFTGWFDYGQG